MRIMVVDDEEDVQFLYRQKFRKELRKGKIEMYFALSGKEALEHLEAQGADDMLLILSDINMPRMNGLELLKIIKENYPHIKVFMITAYGDEENYRLAMEYGADDYLHKPVEFEMLKEKILDC